MKSQFPAAALRACSRCGVVPSRYFLAVNIARQCTALFYRREGFYVPGKTFRCSTSKYGIGEVAGSNRTPRGLHRVAQKIGGGWPVGAAFKSRQVIGFTWQGQPLAPIAHRILWLEGLEPGLNRGGNVDSRARYIYIHGTGNEATLGRPDSDGCIHLSSGDLLPLYDKLPEGTLVWIAER
jgi:lipoprotein-anchoring transpeptidase ErfK/SrfK